MTVNLIPIGDNKFQVDGALTIAGVDQLQRLLNEHQKADLDLTAVAHFDSAAALVLWNHWNRSLPDGAILSDKQRMLFDRIRAAPPPLPSRLPRKEIRRKTTPDRNWGSLMIGLLETFGQLLIDCAYVLRNPRALPMREISAACYRTGVTGLPITTVVGFLIGIVLSYLSSLSLRDFGAESFLPMVMGIGVLRELGPLLTAIVLAGRSGSAITAGIGAMRLTQELDALAALGISQSLRLVLPRTVALTLMTPLLTVCTNAAALLGGLVAGWVELDISPEAFLMGLRHDVPISDMWIGLFKSLTFGGAVAVIACYFGLSAKANTQSLATNTTRSVVLAISVIILLDALFAILFKDL